MVGSTKKVFWSASSHPPSIFGGLRGGGKFPRGTKFLFNQVRPTDLYMSEMARLLASFHFGELLKLSSKLNIIIKSLYICDSWSFLMWPWSVRIHAKELKLTRRDRKWHFELKKSPFWLIECACFKTPSFHQSLMSSLVLPQASATRLTEPGVTVFLRFHLFVAGGPGWPGWDWTVKLWWTCWNRHWQICSFGISMRPGCYFHCWCLFLLKT